MFVLMKPFKFSIVLKWKTSGIETGVTWNDISKELFKPSCEFEGMFETSGTDPSSLENSLLEFCHSSNGFRNWSAKFNSI